jgi:hypothetical protein
MAVTVLSCTVTEQIELCYGPVLEMLGTRLSANRKVLP